MWNPFILTSNTCPEAPNIKYGPQYKIAYLRTFNITGWGVFSLSLRRLHYSKFSNSKQEKASVPASPRWPIATSRFIYCTHGLPTLSYGPVKKALCT